MLSFAIPPIDKASEAQAAERQRALTKPPGSLGALEDVVVRIAGMRGAAVPVLTRPAIVVAAGSHGITEDEPVSAYPSAVTREMVRNFLRGGAAISVLAREMSCDLLIVDAGVDTDCDPDGSLLVRKIRPGTRSFLRGDALEWKEVSELIARGRTLAHDLAARGVDTLITGEMGIGNTTAAAALTAAALGLDPATVTGRGTMVDDAGHARKVAVVGEAVHLRRANAEDGLSLLSAFGGCETAFLTGLMIGAAEHRIPVVLDGFPVGAAALAAVRIDRRVAGYLIAGHRSAEHGHRAVLDSLALRPLIDLDLRLGEASGAALAFPLIRAALRCHAEMATFASAEVSGRSETRRASPLRPDSDS